MGSCERNCEKFGCDICHETVKNEWHTKCTLVPETYRKLFRFPAFNPVQSEAFHIMTVDKRASFAACSGTGTGKTAIAEMAIIDEINNGGKVVYIGPLRALVDEKMTEWTERFPDYKCIAVTMETKRDDLNGKTGSELDDVLKTKNLILASFEMFNSWTIKMEKTYKFLKDVTLLVVDEVHNLADKARGGGLEGAITRFMIAKKGDVRVIFLSATFDNAIDLQKWVEEFVPSFHVINIPFSPIIRHFKTIEYKGRSDAATQALASEVLSGLNVHKQGVIGLVYSKPAVKQIVETVNSSLGNGMCMAHTASVERKLRHKAEKDFRSGELPCIVASPTIAMGVNLPCVNMNVIADFWNHDEKERQLIPPHAFHQIIGRAGRPPFFKDAYITTIVKNDLREDFEKAINAPNVIRGTVLETLDAVLCAEITVRESISLAEIFEWYSKLFSSITSQLTKDEIKEVFKETISWLLEHKFIYADRNQRLRADKKGIACARFLYRPRQLEYVIAVLNSNSMFSKDYSDWSELDYIGLVNEIYDSKYSDIRIVDLDKDVRALYNYEWMQDKRSGKFNWTYQAPEFPFIQQIAEDMSRLFDVLSIVGLRSITPQMVALKNIKKSFEKGGIPIGFVLLSNALEAKGVEKIGIKRLLLFWANGIRKETIFAGNFPLAIRCPRTIDYSGFISEDFAGATDWEDASPIIPPKTYSEILAKVSN